MGLTTRGPHVQARPAVAICAALLGSGWAPAVAGAAPCVWRIGEFFDGNGEFADITARQHVFEAPADWARRQSFAVPAVLAHDPSHGCTSLVVTFDLQPGTYALARSFVRPTAEEAVVCQAFADDSELGVYHVARMGEDWVRRPAPGPLGEPPDEYDLVYYPFVCVAPGRHRVELRMGIRPRAECPLALDALAVVRWKPQVLPHSLRQEIPGRVYLDAWGWNATVNFQRRGRADWDYFTAKLIDEPAARGANFIQLHPHIASGIFDKTGIDPYELLEYIHAKDMFADEHVFPPQQMRADRDSVLEWMRQEWAPASADAWERGWRRAVDGFEGEAFNVIFEPQDTDFRTNELVWPSNPGLYLNHAGYPEEAPWYLKAQYRAPNYIKSYVNCHFIGPLAIAAEGGKSPPIHGFDDHDPIPKFFNCAGLHRAWGAMFYGYQADCRVVGVRASSRSPRRFGGGSYPEWMVKQIDDFCRQRAFEPDDPHASVVWWLGEPASTLPAQYREYVYVASQDPIKRAVTASLARNGVGGWLQEREAEIRREAAAEGYTAQQIDSMDWHFLRPRYHFPADTQFIQNNYLALYLSPRHDGGTLLCDVQRSAHYDTDSLSVPLTQTALATWIDGRAPAFGQTFTVDLAGGHFARLQAHAQCTAEGAQFPETRAYEVANDAPFVSVTIRRAAAPEGHRVSTVLGAEGYERLSYVDAPGPTGGVFAAPDLPQVLLLESRAAPRPPLALFILDAGNADRVQWDPGKALTISSPSGRLELQRIAWGLPAGLYRATELTEVARGLRQSVREAAFDATGMTVHNDLRVPWVQPLRIRQGGKAPYLVQENGWWIVRGAQRALGGEQDDWLKVYLPPSGSVRVVPYGLIDGIVKPGWGSQYQLVIGNVRGDDARAACDARILSVTPFLFAPRVQFARPIMEASLDGKPWQYFDGDILFLPNEVGEHSVRVRYGEQSLPSITRTYASVKRFDVSSDEVRFEAAAPPWHNGMPAERSFYAFVRLGGRAVGSVSGGAIVKSAPDRLCIAFRPGVVALRLR